MLSRRPAVVLCALFTSLALTAGSCEDPTDGLVPTPPAELTELTFGVYGPPEEIAAYEALVQTYNNDSQGTEVTVESWPTRQAMQSALAAGERRPDVFQLSRKDLLAATLGKVNRPVLELLDERGVDFGDGYSRDALMAFSENGELQCMPYGISPEVIYYNTDLIDFGKMTTLGLDAPTPDEPVEIGPDVDELATEEAQGTADGEPTDGASSTASPGPTTDPSADPSADPSEIPSGTPTDGESTDPLEGPVGPSTYRRWTFEQFVAAAEFASRPRRGSKGVYVEPTLAGLTPFIYAAGGDVYNDEEPTSLSFSEDSTREALRTLLPVLRDPGLTPTEEDLQGTTPLELFQNGELGMLPGFRSLTPELRGAEDLNFDVMPIPTIEGSATVGDVTAMCISEKAPNIAQAADFLVYVVSDEAVARVTTSGYLVPANLKVLQSEDFLDSTRMPTNSQIFTSTLRDVRPGPLMDQENALAAAVDPTIELLMTTPVLSDLDPLTVQIDEESRTVLNPDEPSEPTDQGTDPSGDENDG
ncbi:hypothetical protein GCM10027020_04950 [Nocardioides salsibiostraticola]